MLPTQNDDKSVKRKLPKLAMAKPEKPVELIESTPIPATALPPVKEFILPLESSADFCDDLEDEEDSD